MSLAALPPTAPSRWLHRWAVLTAGVTVAALLTGAVVTTFRVGMADPIWPTYPWHLLLISWQEPSAGFLIEHTHRLADYLLGCCVIILAVGLWRADGGRLRWLGAAALGGVVFQGLLGGLRVRLHALVGTDLAFVHGCFAQLVFALLASLALLTAPAAGVALPEADARRLGRGTLAVAVLVYLQLVLGGLVRHTHAVLGPRGHLLVAFAVVAAVAWLAKAVWDTPAARRELGGPVRALGVLVALQLALGVEAWMARFGAGGYADFEPVTVRQAAVRTAHFLLGSLIFAVAVVAAVRVRGRAVAPAPAGRLEGAA